MKPGRPPAPPAGRRRAWLLPLGVGLALAAGALAWYGAAFGWPAALPPPLVAAATIGPATAAAAPTALPTTTPAPSLPTGTAPPATGTATESALSAPDTPLPSGPTTLPGPTRPPLPPGVLGLARVALPPGVTGRLRAAPNGAVVAALPGASLVYVLAGRETTGDGAAWVQVRAVDTNQSGWAVESWLEYVDAAAAPAATGRAEAAQAALPCSSAGLVPADWLVVVNRETRLPRDYAPADLAEVPLDPRNLGYRPVLLRQPAHQPLLALLAAMNEAGLSVWAMSGYRSYSEQTLAYQKWQQLYPDRAAEISALPGHSEHQLGTAVDFTTPYMVDRYGDFFNVRFEQTPEGQWLLRHAVEYGFTLSYPAAAVAATGYAFEPWHYRYVGALAPELQTRNLTLTEFLRDCAPQ